MRPNPELSELAGRAIAVSKNRVTERIVSTLFENTQKLVDEAAKSAQIPGDIKLDFDVNL